MASSKKKKPIMTKKKHNEYLTLNEIEQLEILDRLSDQNKARIGKWLDTVEVKENIEGEPYVINPFVGLPLYTNTDLSYLTLYNWCLINFEKVKLPKPLDKIFYYANEWKKKATINPYTKEEIRVSLNPNGEYVRLYKNFIEGLVDSYILKNKTNKILSIE